MTADRHKVPTLRFRAPEPERLWLLAYQEHTGKPMNAILTEAVRRLRAGVERNWNEDPVARCNRCSAPASCSEFGRCVLENGESAATEGAPDG